MPADLGAIIAQQRAERAEQIQRQLAEDANRLCAFCKGVQRFSCSCRSDCGRADCPHRVEGTLPADWLWNARALAEVPRFRCDTWRLLRGVD